MTFAIRLALLLKLLLSLQVLFAPILFGTVVAVLQICTECE